MGEHHPRKGHDRQGQQGRAVDRLGLCPPPTELAPATGSACPEAPAGDVVCSSPIEGKARPGEPTLGLCSPGRCAECSVWPLVLHLPQAQQIGHVRMSLFAHDGRILGFWVALRPNAKAAGNSPRLVRFEMDLALVGDVAPFLRSRSPGAKPGSLPTERR